MPTLRDPRRSLRKLLHLSVALLLGGIALGVGNVHATSLPLLCINCSAVNPCTGQEVTRVLCCPPDSRPSCVLIFAEPGGCPVGLGTCVTRS